jgi:2-alkyl-3-oxoalkanoate reductase
VTERSVARSRIIQFTEEVFRLGVSMKIFIAGATGVLGRRLVKQFRDRGHVVQALARNTKNEATIHALGAESRSGDLFYADSLARAGEGADVVIHAATAIPTGAKPSPSDWQTNDRIRREGTRALSECAARVGAKLFLVQSITWVARPANQGSFDEDSPFHPDAITRSTEEMETIANEAGERSGFGVGILRFGWFYSADSAHTRYFGENLAARKLPIIGKGDAIWSWIHVEDAASAFVTVAEAQSSGLWHVVDNEPVVSSDYLRYFAKRLGAAEPRHVPVWLARMLAGSAAVDFMTSSTRTSNERFRREFNWNPRFPSYREGLEEVIARWRAENFLGLSARSAA